MGANGDHEKFFKRYEGKRGIAHFDALRAYVESYQPDGTNYGYKAEMDNRVLYLSGAMQKDMNEILKRQFELTFEDYKREMVNLKLMRSIIHERAQVFPESTKFVLIDRETGDELEPDDKGEGLQAKQFASMIKDGLWPTVLRSADALVQTCNRVGLKAWYDQDIEDVRLSAYPPQDVMIVRNPFRPWSPYTAPAVMFRHASMLGDGYCDMWEVWSTGDLKTPDGEDERGLPIWLPTAHYMTDGGKEYHINENDENPFKDLRHDDRPIVPYTWMSDDGGTDLYVFGQEDLLTLNRVCNWGMTSLHISVINQAFAIPYFHAEAGKSVKVPKDLILSPKRLWQLPKGVEIRFASPDLDIEGPTALYDRLMKWDAIFSGLDSEVVTVEARTGEQSGRALRIKQTRLEKFISPLRENYAPPVEEIMARGIIVHNYYKDRVKDRVEIDLLKYKPTVIFGDLKVPVDSKEEGESFMVEIEHDVSTPIDWLMKKAGITRDEAEKRLEANAAYNKETRDARRIIPIDESDEDIEPGEKDTGDTDQDDDIEE